jgi:hypothetical protein
MMLRDLHENKIPKISERGAVPPCVSLKKMAFYLIQNPKHLCCPQREDFKELSVQVLEDLGLAPIAFPLHKHTQHDSH